MKKRYTIKELAAVAGVHPKVISRLADTLAGYQAARPITFATEAIEQVKARRRQGRPRKSTPGASQTGFPCFWFDGHEWHGWVRGAADLDQLEAAYPDGQWRKAHRCDRSTDRPNFGFRAEHLGGSVTLGEWLEQQQGEK